MQTLNRDCRNPILIEKLLAKLKRPLLFDSVQSIFGVLVILSRNFSMMHITIVHYLLVLIICLIGNINEIAQQGGIELILESMRCHERVAKVQGRGCWILQNLAFNEGNDLCHM